MKAQWTVWSWQEQIGKLLVKIVVAYYLQLHNAYCCSFTITISYYHQSTITQPLQWNNLHKSSVKQMRPWLKRFSFQLPRAHFRCQTLPNITILHCTSNSQDSLTDYSQKIPMCWSDFKTISLNSVKLYFTFNKNMTCQKRELSLSSLSLSRSFVSKYKIVSQSNKYLKTTYRRMPVHIQCQMQHAFRWQNLVGLSL